MGNHEDAMLEFLEERSDGRAWLSYGGLETLMSLRCVREQFALRRVSRDGFEEGRSPGGAGDACRFPAELRSQPHRGRLRVRPRRNSARPEYGATDAARSVVDSRRLPARAVGLTGQSRGARAHHLR